MRVTLLPTVQGHRDLYAIPRGQARFDAYLRMLTQGGREPVLPVGLSNPMAKEHLLAYCDALLTMDAEALAREAAKEAERRLAGVDLDLRIGFAIADDVAGGWTDRALTEMKHRFENGRALRTGLGCALLWAGEPPTPARVRAAVLAECYRHAYGRTHGAAETLAAMMRQEGSPRASPTPRSPTSRRRTRGAPARWRSPTRARR